MNKLKVLLEENADKIAAMITAEHGKVLADAHGELQRGIENVEYASYAPELLKGEHSRNVGPGIDSAGANSRRWASRQASRPSTFRPWCRCGCGPWPWPAATPSCSSRRARPHQRAVHRPARAGSGLPPGVLNVVNGDKLAVDTLLQGPARQGRELCGLTPSPNTSTPKAASTASACRPWAAPRTTPC